MKQHKVDTKALQDVLDYLNERPYKEVVNLIKGIMDSAEPVKVPPPVEVSAPPHPVTPLSASDEMINDKIT